MQPVYNSKYLINPPQANKNAFEQRVSPAITNGGTRLKLFYTNDWHGQTDNLGGILGASLQFDSSTKGQNFDTLKLLAGDAWSGANVKKNNLIVHLMNYMGFDATTIGNHEIDANIDNFEKTAQESKNTQFVCANLMRDDGSELKNVKKSVIKEENGHKYGIIGLAPLDLKTVLATDKSEGVQVQGLEDSIKSVQAEVEKLKSQGVNKIILLSHIAKEYDEKIAPMLDGVDIIVGGHSHDKIDNAQIGKNVVKSKSGEPIIILQAGQNAENYGILNVDFDDKGVLTFVSNTIMDTPKKKNSVIDSILDMEVGVSPTVAHILESDPAPSNRKSEPCAWTDILADSMRSELNTDVALVNAANVRKVPQAGKLTERDIEESTPMKNDLIVTTMSEEQLVSGIKSGAERTMTSPDGYPGLIHTSGFKYEIDTNGKLLSISFVDKDGKETAIDPNNPSKDKMYTVALDTFLSNGNEYPEMVPKHETKTFKFDKDTTVKSYLSKRQDKDKFTVKDDGRLKITQTSKNRQQSSSTRNVAA